MIPAAYENNNPMVWFAHINNIIFGNVEFHRLYIMMRSDMKTT